MHMSQEKSDAYNKYVDFKGWNDCDFGFCSENKYKYYSSLIQHIAVSLPASASVLELGFGNGSFLGFCKRMKWQVVGIEVIESLVKLAKANGFSAYEGSSSDFRGKSFDLICAFDVLEHIATNQLVSFLGDLGKLMNASSYLLVSFPNGDSPFSLPNQNGDLTHLNFIGRSKLNQAALMADLRVAKYLGAQAYERQCRHDSVLRRMLLLSRRVARYGGSKIVEYLFLNPGNKVDFFSQNTIAILVKAR